MNIWVIGKRKHKLVRESTEEKWAVGKGCGKTIARKTHKWLTTEWKNLQFQ